jgi:hypothetical protein
MRNACVFLVVLKCWQSYLFRPWDRPRRIKMETTYSHVVNRQWKQLIRPPGRMQMNPSTRGFVWVWFKESRMPLPMYARVTFSQMERVVVKFLQDNPKKLNPNQSALVQTALSKAFPCLKKK